MRDLLLGLRLRLRSDAVVAVRAEAIDAREFGEPALRATTSEDSDEVDGLGDQRPWDGDDGFLDELLEAAQRTDPCAGMDGADAARVTGPPGLEQVESFGAATSPTWNAVWSQSQRGPHQIRQGGDTVFGAHGDEVGCGDRLARVLDDDDAIRGLGDLGEQRIGECGLAGRGAAGDKDVGPGGDRLAQSLGLVRRHDSGGHIVVEREDCDGRFADRESRRRNNWGQQALKALPRLGQFGRHPRIAGMDLGADMVRDESHDPFAICGRQLLACIRQAFGQPVDPEPAVRIEHHLDDRRIFQKPRDGRSKGCAQYAPRVIASDFW